MFSSNNETNDDDDLFVPSASSSSNLAHLFGAQGDLKTSLTYTPPKQLKPADSHPPHALSQQQKKLVCVKTITLSRLVESSYSNVGKFGIAIIADQVSADLILYKTKQNILSTTKLTTNFCYKRINDAAITFTDDQTLSWMVTFDTAKDKMDFTLELAKQGVEKQDVAPDMNAVDNSSNISDSFSSRLIAEKPEEEKTRADILGRMSKLGMSILPGAESTSNSPLLPKSSVSAKLPSRRDKELSESEPEEVIRTSKARKIRARHSESAIETMDLIPKPQVGPSSQFTPYAANVQHVTLGHQLMDPLNIYFAENRTHNSEVRMNLSQLGSKIDTLLNELRPQSSLRSRDLDEREYFERRIVELERKLDQVSSKNVDNDASLELRRQLEAQIKENAQNVLKYDEIISSLRNGNESLSNTLEMERDSHSEELKLKNEKVVTSEAAQKDLECKINELEKLVENQKLKLADFAEFNKQNQEEKLERLARETAAEDLKRRSEFLQVSLNQSNKKIEELEILYRQVLESRAKEEDVFADLVKETMNVMYQSVLTESIDSTTNLDVRDLQKILQKHLKSTTFVIINQYSKRKDVDILGANEQPSVSPEFEVTV